MALIPDSMVIPDSSGSLQMADHTLMDVSLANVYLDSPYYRGHCKEMCVRSAIYPMINDNVRSARQMLPDPQWKAEDQTGARAQPVKTTTITRTTKLVICLVGCSNRSPTEKTLRIETQRRSQPNSRRTVLHKISKSKKAPQKCCWTSLDEGSGKEE